MIQFSESENMQNPDEDTEWNDILRAKGIIPEKKKVENFHPSIKMLSILYNLQYYWLYSSILKD